MEDRENSKIVEACNIIMHYHFVYASEAFYETESNSVKDQTQKAMDNSCKSSTLAILIKENKWDELFKNEKWLNFLRGAQYLGVFNKNLNGPLLFLSKTFPNETEYHIIPGLIRE